MEPVRGYHFSNSRESRERRRVPLPGQISRPATGEEKPKRAGLKDQRYISEGREKAGERVPNTGTRGTFRVIWLANEGEVFSFDRTGVGKK
jgi:hypothetical protein